MTLLLLDAFCKAGGASMGYHRAGFRVVGVDIEPQPRYPFEFHQGDALAFIREHGWKFDAIAASPPCHDHTPLKSLAGLDGTGWLLAATREELDTLGKPYVLENVMSAPLIKERSIRLCGGMFGLRTYRHRQFESRLPLVAPAHPKHVIRTATKQRRLRWAAGDHVFCHRRHRHLHRTRGAGDRLDERRRTLPGDSARLHRAHRSAVVRRDVAAIHAVSRRRSVRARQPGAMQGGALVAVSKRVRFEVLRRDNYQCRYCGAAAPDVPLTVDHVVPVALGGTDEPSNLVAACQDCNAGKSSATPDQALVADVEADALRWAAAMERAAEEDRARKDVRDGVLAAVAAAWPSYRRLPSGWESAIGSFLDAGLSAEVIVEMVHVANEARGVDYRWGYFCGCCWNRVRKLQDRAREIVAEPDGEVS